MQLYKVTDLLINMIEVTSLHSIHMSSHCVVHLKYIIFICQLKPNKGRRKIKTHGGRSKF